MFLKYRRSVRKPSMGIRVTLSVILYANCLVANAGKCHLLTSYKIRNNITNNNTNASSEQKVKLLGINLESRWNFDYQ